MRCGGARRVRGECHLPVVRERVGVLVAACVRLGRGLGAGAQLERESEVGEAHQLVVTFTTGKTLPFPAVFWTLGTLTSQKQMCSEIKEIVYSSWPSYYICGRDSRGHGPYGGRRLHRARRCHRTRAPPLAGTVAATTPWTPSTARARIRRLPAATSGGAATAGAGAAARRTRPAAGCAGRARVRAGVWSPKGAPRCGTRWLAHHTAARGVAVMCR
jgi:hypothetical protein